MKQGYVIAKSKLQKEFFTATSAYDRPRWTPITEATVYVTAELADRALKKLIKNGQYQVMISEMNLSMSPIEPMGDAPMGAVGDEELPPEDGADLPPEEGDLEGEGGEGEDEDAMVAGSEEEVCPECEHSPCTCEDSGDLGDEDLDDDTLVDVDDAGIEGEGDISDEELESLLGGDESGEGSDELGSADLEGEDFPRRGGLGEAADASKQRVDTLKFKDPAQDTTDKSQFTDTNCEKVRVPAGLMSELNAVVADFDKQAKFSQTSDIGRASYAMTVADACRDIADLLKVGTVESVKMANVRLSSYMNAITQHIPASVIKFIYSGGQKPSLKDMFNAKREESK